MVLDIGIALCDGNAQLRTQSLDSVLQIPKAHQRLALLIRSSARHPTLCLYIPTECLIELGLMRNTTMERLIVAPFGIASRRANAILSDVAAARPFLTHRVQTPRIDTPCHSRPALRQSPRQR